MFNLPFLYTYQPLHLASNSFLLHTFLLLVLSSITHYHLFYLIALLLLCITHPTGVPDGRGGIVPDFFSCESLAYHYIGVLAFYSSSFIHMFV